MKGIYRHIVFGFALLLLFAPLIDKLVKVDRRAKLRGAVDVVADTNFAWVDWFSGNYQEKKEAYVSNSFGWRNSLVRLNNQIHYSLFGKIRAKSVVEGKEGYLYESAYIDSYLGSNFVGKAAIDEKVRKMRALHEVFAAKEKHLLIVLAAGKGTYYPQYFPERYDGVEKKLSNYEYYVESLSKQDVPHIDFNQHFLDIRDTTAQVLYPKSGIHWSRYGEVLVMDSLLQNFEELLQKDVPELKRTWSVQSPPLKRDNDLEKGMNLLFAYDDTEMTYQAFEFEKEGKYLPNVLFIADSFYWGLHNEGFTRGPFDSANFWFYNQSVWPSEPGKVNTKDLNYKEEIEKRDVVVILGAEATLNNFGYGAIDRMYKLFVEAELDAPKSLPE